MRTLQLTICLLGAALLTPCKAQEEINREAPWEVAPMARVGELPPYAEVAVRYNRNLAHLDRLWARADVTFEYLDEKKKKQSDRADDSKLMVVPPDRVALSLGHAFGDVLWAGTDGERYWAFDLHSDERPVYVGRLENLGRPTTQPLPSPIYPHEVPAILGLLPLPADSGATVEWYEGRWLVEDPATQQRLLLDPATALPRRVDVVNDDGFSIIAVRLDDFVQVEVEGISAADYPWAVSEVRAWMLYRDANIKMKLSGHRTENPAFKVAFDFERLMKAHKPKEVIDLDAAPVAER